MFCVNFTRKIKTGDEMYFSDYFKVNPQLIENHGAININLVCDLPLFIDPMLIFNSDKDEYMKLHQNIIEYFHFLAGKSKSGIRDGDLMTYYNFSEIKNNWLGYSKVGNEGNGNGKAFAKFFSEHISFALETNGISSGEHYEKALLLFDGKNGRDKISDLTTHLILDYLATYTQNFAIKNIAPQFLDNFYLENAKFNYETETFMSLKYKLPFIIKNGKREFVLLTPIDILRKEEPTINKLDLERNYNNIRNIIDNSVIRSQLENYIAKAVMEYEQKNKTRKKKITKPAIAKVEKEAFLFALRDMPELYDYYIKLKEDSKDEVNTEALLEVKEQVCKYYQNSFQLIRLYKSTAPTYPAELNAHEEAKYRIKHFKHIIENCEGYKLLYYNNTPISKEDDLQRLFRFVWYGSFYDVNYETNNGNGELDIKVSCGANEKCIIEFKLASNSRLPRIFEQVAVYERANLSKDSLYVIFYFNQNEKETVMRMLRNAKKDDLIDENIFLIDCNNKKVSASKI